MPGLIGRRVERRWCLIPNLVSDRVAFQGTSYLCSGHPAWWLWSHVRECPLQPGSCAPASPGRSRWWHTPWPCPAPSTTTPGGRTLSWNREWEGVSEWVKDQQLLPANLGKTIVLNSVESWPLPRHILMDAFKTSLRVVLAHIRQVKIKIVEGVGGRVALRNFNTLWRGRKKKNSCLITNITWHCYGLYSLNSKWIWFKSITTTDTPKVINIYLNISSWTPVEQPCKIKIIYQHKESISWTVCFRGHLLKSSAS